MNKSKKQLRDFSFLVLLLAGVSLIQSIAVAIAVGFSVTAESLSGIPEGISEEMLKIALIVTWAIGLLLLLPRIYIGLKGLKASKEPVNGKAHIVWGIILIVLSSLTVISSLGTLVESKNLFTDIMTLVSAVVDVIIFAIYVKSAREVAKEG